MDRLGIHILCVQETHIAGTDSYFTDAGSLIILSGGAPGEREYAGVAFIIPASIRPFVIGYKEHINRLASLRIRILAVYAPITIAEYVIQ